MYGGEYQACIGDGTQVVYPLLHCDGPCPRAVLVRCEMSYLVPMCCDCDVTVL